ncbi:hypothetical protein SGL43_04111 [Streptomyces globisporus]|uniref:Uncharacterized protein n=1 Tax=Streptomyces globisporus TaxID=1908 RepID=A0ABM9H0F4_STRGL|nr:hypothetical protein SGL43_04111 [Streptomyces globisporus]
MSRLNDRAWQVTDGQPAWAHIHVHETYGPHSGSDTTS